MEHHYVPIHHPLFNLTLQYQNFSSVFDISQGCDHVVKALGLNYEVHDCCFVKVLAYWPSSSSCWWWCSQVTSCNCCPLCVVLLFLRCNKFFFVALVCMFSSHSCPPFFFCWFSCFQVQPSSFLRWSSWFQVVAILLFVLVFLFSSFN